MFTRRAAIIGAVSLGLIGLTACEREGSGDGKGKGEGGNGAGEKPGGGGGDGRTVEGGKGGGREQMTRIRAPFGGVERTAFVFVPHRPSATQAPLVMGQHGHGQQPSDVFERMGWMRTLEDNGWYGLFPEHGDVPEDKMVEGDVDYNVHILTRVLRDHPIDASRVYGVGFSGGGLRTHKLAGAHSELLAAIATGSSAIGLSDNEIAKWSPAANRAKPLSVMHVHGLRDKTTPFDGGASKTGNPAYPVRDGMLRWVGHMKAKAVADCALPEGVPTRHDITEWRTDSGHVVRLLVDPNLDHEWPGLRDKFWYNDLAVKFFQAAPPRS